MSQSLENPVVKLAPIVVRLYELSGYSKLDKAVREQLYALANELRGDMVNLTAVQIRNNTSEYADAMQRVASVNTALSSAQADIDKIIQTVDDITGLTKSIDALLQTVAKAAIL